jgi:hypothetical protein
VEFALVTIDPNEAAASLQDIAAVERRTREAVFYAGSSAIFIMWGLLVACGYVVAGVYPQSGRLAWLILSAVGCAATALIVGLRMRARPREAHDWRIVLAMLALTAFAAVWSYLLSPIVPRPMMYAFQPSLFLLGVILFGLWLGRFFIVLGLVGIAFIIIGYLQEEPLLRLWMGAAQSGTLILGGVWLRRSGVPR